MGIRVLHVRSTIGMYGAEHVVLNLMKQAKINGDHYSLACIEGMTAGSEVLAQRVDGIAQQIYRFKTAKKLDFGVIREIRKLLPGYDVVHTHDYKSLMYVCIARLFFNEPDVFHHIHGALGNSRMERIYARIEKFLLRFVDGVVTVSDLQRAALSPYVKSLTRISQIDNGVFVPALSDHPVLGKTLQIVMVARFTPEKDHKTALDVLHGLLNKGVAAHLTLLGDGPLIDEVKNYALSLDLSPAVTFAGFTQDVTSWLKRSDVLLITSKTEGMPMAMLEAMAASLVIVSTPVGQIPDIINKAACGSLSSDTQSLTQQLVYISQHPDIAWQWGKNGHQFALNNFSVSRQITDIHSFYKVAAAAC